MRRSATDLKGAFGNYKDEGDEDVSKDGYSMALVPVDEAKMKKQRNERLKNQAKQIADKSSGAGGPVKSGKVIFDVDAGADDGTFVTGVGIPGRSKKNNKV